MAWLALLLPALPVAAQPPVAHELQVVLEPETRALVASDRIHIAAGTAVELRLAAHLVVTAFDLDDEPADTAGEVTGGVRRWRLPASPEPRQVTLAWQGRLAPLDATQDHRDTLGPARAVADPRGSFLPAASLWYPRSAQHLASHRVRLELPTGQRGLVSGTLTGERERDGRWHGEFEFAHAGDGIDLMAGPYRLRSRTLDSVDGRTLTVRTWFHPELAPLADGYLESALGYLQLYERWIGPYPFGDFSIVSSPTPTGFGMPGLTYLGIEVLRLPFIRHTSLGHEVLHNWWGNGVYVDYTHGNWAEGLTTFMADYHYREQRGEDAAEAQRLAWLRDFAAVPPVDDRPLASFTARSHGASQVVGYHKAAMLFLMLRDRLGQQTFDRGVRRFWQAERFSVAGWSELRQAFESAAGRDLGDAFEPWLNRRGAPAPGIDSATARGKRVELVLTQPAPAWPLRLPLRFHTAAGEVTRVVEFTTERERVVVELPAAASESQVDPEFRLFRRLAPSEAPPILRDLMLVTRPAVLALAGAETQAVQALAARLFEHASITVDGARAVAEPVLLVVGGHDAVDAWLAGAGLPPRPASMGERDASAEVWVSGGGEQVVAVVSLREPSALPPLLRPLPHHGGQSWLRFDGGRALARGVWPARPPRIPVAPAQGPGAPP